MGRSVSRKALKKLIWDKTNGICAHCGKPTNGKAATVDHFVPVSWGGSYDQRNLMPLCSKCNRIWASREIVPSDYYRYAPAWAIEDCKDYKKEWESSHTNAAGELMLDNEL